MKNTFSKNKTCLGFLLSVFLEYGLCYFLSQTVLHKIYLFEWAASHYYLCLWAAPVTFCFLEMYKAALITTVGNRAGAQHRAGVHAFQCFADSGTAFFLECLQVEIVPLLPLHPILFFTGGLIQALALDLKAFSLIKRNCTRIFLIHI